VQGVIGMLKNKGDRMQKMADKSQAWSMDAMVAVGLFIFAVMMLYYFIGSGSDAKLNDVVYEEGKAIPELLSSLQNNSLSFIVAGSVDRGKLERFANLSYNETKKSFGLTSDFCIYFEDEAGNLVNISGGLVGIGSEKGRINGKECGKW
jgi:hypothetical protein